MEVKTGVSNELTTEQERAAAAAPPVGAAAVPFHLTRSESKNPHHLLLFYDHLFSCSGDVSVSLTAPEAVCLSVCLSFSVMD